MAAGEGDSDGVIYVALHEHNEAVALRQDALPADPEDVLNLLSSEAAPLLCWFDTAKAYLSRAKAAAFLDIVKEANSDETLQGIRAYFNREPTFERVQLFCAMAAYYIEAARLERDSQNKAAMIAHAETCIKEAEALRSNEMLPSMARAMLALARSDTTAAMMECRRAEKLLHNGRRNHAPLLAQAAIHYNSGSLAAAMNIYTTVLRQNPQCPPEFRLGIAACYYRAGKLEQATAAYNRVLELDPQCADALLGLAVIKFGSRDTQEGLNSGLQLLQRAFAADPSHPGVLCALSHFSLLKGESDQALQLAQAALEASDTDRLRGVALSLLGRCHHAVGDLAAAQHHYAQAIRLDPKAPLPHLGTAQVYLATGGDPTNAVSELEEVLKALPGNSDALWLLGGLLPVLPDRVAKTLSRHREAAQRQVNDAGLQELLGELLATSDPADSLTAFQQALTLHRKKQAAVAERNKARQQRRQKLMDAGDELSQELLAEVEDEPLPGVPAKLLNNAAVLKYRAGQVAEALQLMSEATSVMMTDNSTSPMHKVSMGYNMARLQEATGDCKSASAGYQALLQQFPGYIDCYLRLAAMAKAAGDVEGARRWAASATEQAGGHVDSQAMLANLHLERGDLTAARTCVEAVKKEAGRDPYMLLTHANVVLAALPADRQTKTPAADKENHKQFILKALAMYREVLRQQPDNIYAVNGLGTCLAELGHLAAAKQAFDEVIRATSKTKGFVKMPECYVNLGNVWLARKQYNDAIKMYELASRLHHHKNPQILLYQARAQHDAGDHLAAKASLLRAIHLAPGSIKMRFDLAFVLQEWAVRVFKRKYPPADSKKLSEYIQAEDSLQQAERMFTALAAMSKDVSRIEPRKLCMHRDFCTKQLPMAAALVKAATEEAHKAALQQKLRDAELAQAEAQRRHREVMSDAAKRAQEQKKKEEALKAREACDARVAEMRARRALAPPEEDGGGGGKGGGKKKRKKGAAGEAMDDFYVDDTTPIERLPKKGEEAKKDKLKRAGLDSDDDDDAIDEENLFGSGGGSDDEQQQQQQQQQGSDGEAGPWQAGGGGRGRLKRRAAGDGDAQPAAPADGAEDGDDLFGDEGVDAEPGTGGGQGGDSGFVDSLFADEGEEDEGAGAAQPRKRQRQALASDDEDEEAAAAADGGGGAGDGEEDAAGDGDAGGADDVMGLGDEEPEGLGNGDAGPALGGDDDDMEDLFG